MGIMDWFSGGKSTVKTWLCETCDEQYDTEQEADDCCAPSNEDIFFSRDKKLAFITNIEYPEDYINNVSFLLKEGYEHYYNDDFKKKDEVQHGK